jgi:hypothetical protein
MYVVKTALRLCENNEDLSCLRLIAFRAYDDVVNFFLTSLKQETNSEGGSIIDGYRLTKIAAKCRKIKSPCRGAKTR